MEHGSFTSTAPVSQSRASLFCYGYPMDAFLASAIEEAEKGRDEGGIPIGAVLVHEGLIIGRGHNRRVQQGSTVLHGEMDALERAGRQPASVLAPAWYSTPSPCAMCSGAILLYGIPHIVGENRTFVGEEAAARARGPRRGRAGRAHIRLMGFIADHPGLWSRRHREIARPTISSSTEHSAAARRRARAPRSRPEICSH